MLSILDTIKVPDYDNLDDFNGDLMGDINFLRYTITRKITDLTQKVERLRPYRENRSILIIKTAINLLIYGQFPSTQQYASIETTWDALKFDNYEKRLNQLDSFFNGIKHFN